MKQIIRGGLPLFLASFENEHEFAEFEIPSRPFMHLGNFKCDEFSRVH